MSASLFSKEKKYAASLHLMHKGKGEKEGPDPFRGKRVPAMNTEKKKEKKDFFPNSRKGENSHFPREEEKWPCGHKSSRRKGRQLRDLLVKETHSGLEEVVHPSGGKKKRVAIVSHKKEKKITVVRQSR